VHEDEYTLIEDIDAPGKDDAGHHLVDYETGKLISNLWSIYLARVREGTAPGPVPALRRTTNDFLTEGFSGQRFQRGIRMVSRTRRGCTFQAALWHADDGRMIQTAEIVTVFVDPAAGKAAEIPTDFWSNVEALEGHAIPVTERSA
jgi:acyl-CoA thioesterase FadM